MLLRRNGTIYALNDRCTHRGGPLHEGTLIDDCIECPWHGSQFHLSDGSVARGPATTPQQSFEVRVDAGRVLVRRTGEQRALRTNAVGSGTPN
jgi:nitrite reductase/ring-hydroxylating ferredoxin subunit